MNEDDQAGIAAACVTCAAGLGAEPAVAALLGLFVGALVKYGPAAARVIWSLRRRKRPTDSQPNKPELDSQADE